jgi:hypothetical protein
MAREKKSVCPCQVLILQGFNLTGESNIQVKARVPLIDKDLENFTGRNTQVSSSLVVKEPNKLESLTLASLLVYLWVKGQSYHCIFFVTSSMGPISLRICP